ncbi:MAG: hypothetical protein ABJC12_08520, partial [Saprospiraceae bacterium]
LVPPLLVPPLLVPPLLVPRGHNRLIIHVVISGALATFFGQNMVIFLPLFDQFLEPFSTQK